GYGVFTFNFTKCYQDSSADKNKDKVVTLTEAYNWLKSSKPKDSNGRDLDSLLKFRLKIKSNGTKNGKNISFEETGITISDESGNFVDEDNRVTMSIGENKFKTTNNKIIEISGGRMWNIESSAENGNFKVDLEVQLDSQYEMLLPELPNIIGMVWRENGTEDWQPQYPSIYNQDNNTITCPRVDHFSDWAAGVISANPTSVDSKFLINNVEYGPNPFKNVFNFEFNLDKPESFSIEVVDITGRRFDFINTKDYGVGTFNVNLDGSKYPSGTYYCRLISESGIRTIKLVKE
ncbi:MAG: T9SS type A sorting domain-containing protein, partial [Candidatus Kapaibacterium sp.]